MLTMRDQEFYITMMQAMKESAAMVIRCLTSRRFLVVMFWIGGHVLDLGHDMSPGPDRSHYLGSAAFILKLQADKEMMIRC